MRSTDARGSGMSEPGQGMDEGLTHLDSRGQLRMVDVGGKEVTAREARAQGRVVVSEGTLEKIADHRIPKGNVFEAARLAGIMAAKRTWDLIPLCHPLQITGIDIEFHLDRDMNEIQIASRVTTWDRTGVEMEALVAVAHAALTIYDMCKAVDKDMRIVEIRLMYKHGGKSGTYTRVT